MIKYLIKVKIDNGHDTFRDVAVTARNAEEAQETVFKQLCEEFRDQVAFFDIISLRRG